MANFHCQVAAVISVLLTILYAQEHSNVVAAVLPSVLFNRASVRYYRTLTADNVYLRMQIPLKLQRRLGVDSTGYDLQPYDKEEDGDDTIIKWQFPILYTFDPNATYNELDERIVRNGLNWWEESTCARFIHVVSWADLQGGEQPYIIIYNGTGCSSHVGNINHEQKISLKDPGCVHPGTVAHEMGHAMGFSHEQQRPDRDNYVTIYRENVDLPDDRFETNFKMRNESNFPVFSTQYDFTSVMHYDAWAFSINASDPSKHTVVPHDVYAVTAMSSKLREEINARWENRTRDNVTNALSFADSKRLNIFYKCTDSCLGSPLPIGQVCLNGGYQDPLACQKCRCPIGLSGTFCQFPAPSHGLGGKACGGVLRLGRCESVNLTSPQYPRPYPALSSCSWHIIAPSGRLVLEHDPADIDMLGTSDYTRLCMDYVEIRTDKSAFFQAGRRLCSCAMMPPLPNATRVTNPSANAEALVIFRSTSNLNSMGRSHRGFNIIAKDDCFNNDDSANSANTLACNKHFGLGPLLIMTGMILFAFHF